MPTRTTVTANIQDLAGIVATSGYVEFRLQPNSSSILFTIPGIGVIPSEPVRATIDSGGNISIQLWGNDLISPGNTVYDVVLAPGGEEVNTIHRLLITGASYNLANPVFAPVVEIVPQFQTVITDAINTNLLPIANNSFNVGQSGRRWATGYFTNLDVVNQPWANLGLGILNVKDFGAVGNDTADDTAAFSAAYAALPANGGIILVPPGTYKITSGINLGTTFKRVTYVGHPGSASTIHFTPSSGTLFTFNYGNDGPNPISFGHGLRDLNLVGPGSGFSAKALIVGGANGCLGFHAFGVRFRNFGTGFELGDHSWQLNFEHCVWTDNNTHLLMPSGLTEAGQDVRFSHCQFNEVASSISALWIKGNNQEVEFVDCSITPQLHVGDSTSTSALVTCINTHFENDSLVANYDMLQVDNHNGNNVKLVNCHFVQTKSASGPARFMLLNGGKTSIFGLSMFTPGGSPLTNLAVLGNAAGVELFSFNDLSGNISGPLLGGSSTGVKVLLPGANTGSTTIRDFLIAAGGTGVAKGPLDIAGSWGNYTPTAVSVANLDVTPTMRNTAWHRMGDYVYVTGVAVVDPTAAAATFTQFRITLPVASNLSSFMDLQGFGGAGALTESAIISGDTANKQAFITFASQSTASHELGFHFWYQVKP